LYRQTKGHGYITFEIVVKIFGSVKYLKLFELAERHLNVKRKETRSAFGRPDRVQAGELTVPSSLLSPFIENFTLIVLQQDDQGVPGPSKTDADKRVESL